MSGPFRYHLENLALCPKLTVLVLHQKSTNAIALNFITAHCCKIEEDDSEIVSSVDLTFIQPYIGFMEEEYKVSIMAAIIEMLANIGHISIFERSAKGTFPAAIKNAFVNILRYLRRHYRGDFVTKRLVAKLRKLITTIWHHGQVYQKFNSRLQQVSPIEATGLIC